MDRFKLVCVKLGQLEDLMEKHKIDSVKELESKIEELNNPHDIWVENNTLTEINNWQNNKIAKLNKQLAGKGKEIEHLQNLMDKTIKLQEKLNKIKEQISE